MNYLQLCQKVVRQGAIQPGDDRPSTVIGQKGRMKLVTEWVETANREIQSMRNDFSFRQRAIDFAVSAGTEVLRPTTTHSDIESINEITASVRDDLGTRPIAPIHWIDYRHRRLNADDPTEDLPMQFSVDTAGDIHFIPVSFVDYLFRAEFKLSPQILVAMMKMSHTYRLLIMTRLSTKR